MEPAIPIRNLSEALDAARASAADGQSRLVVAPLHGFGVGWLAAVCAEAQGEVPGATLVPVADCGDAPGLALAALRHGYRHVLFNVEGPAFAAVADIAGQLGAQVERNIP